MFEPNEVEVVIVGAGPIGLLTAIGLLNKTPRQKIVLLEKYDHYKRNHTLQVNHQQIKKFLNSCGKPYDPALLDLWQQVKRNKFIRISTIENILQARAKALGAEIVTGREVQDFKREVREKYPQASLIIGADGTHSIVSQQAIGTSYVFAEMTADTIPEIGKIYFKISRGQLTYTVINPQGLLVKDKPIPHFKCPSLLDMKAIQAQRAQILAYTTAQQDTFVLENSEKKEFDFVMQLRFEVEGEGEVEAIPFPTLMRLMQNYGMTCDEYVGKKDEQGKTPITLQLMITKAQFKQLEDKAKSGSPIRAFSAEDENASFIPPLLMEQLTSYLGLRLRHFTKEREIVRLDTAAISVNEAPATYAKVVHRRLDNGDGPDVVLVGDAALGLSYFKGINAAFESCAKLLKALSAPDEQKEEKLQKYADWFKKIYAPKKVKEVGIYSRLIIGATVAFFKTLQFIVRKDRLMRADVAERMVDLYCGYLAEVNRQKTLTNPEIPSWRRSYAHSGRFLENVLTFKALPSEKKLQAIKKNFSDFTQPYKSTFHFRRDLITPVRSLYQLSAGALQICTAIPLEAISTTATLLFFKKNKSSTEILQEAFREVVAQEKEGLTRLLLGINLALTVIMVPFKILTRSVLSLKEPQPLFIEANLGVKKLVAQSDQFIQELEAKAPNEQTDSYMKLQALSVDVHRKFHKSLTRGQKTRVESLREQQYFKQCIRDQRMSEYKAYFALFKTSASSDESPATLSNPSLGVS